MRRGGHHRSVVEAPIMYALRRNLMITLLVGIPAMAGTDYRVWPSTSSDRDAQMVVPPVAQTTATSESDTRRLPDVDIAQQHWFVQAQQQLRVCRANYVRLERWNTEPPIFHFRCDLPAQPGDGQSFEALSASPRVAVQHVLSQVTARRDAELTRPSVLSTRPRLAEPKRSNAASWR